jgi:hypothetical protein
MQGIPAGIGCMTQQFGQQLLAPKAIGTLQQQQLLT